MTAEQIKEQLPDNVQPRREREPVSMPVELVGVREFSPEQVKQLQDKLGMVQVNGARLMALPEVGELAMQMGILKTVKGSTLISQDTIVQCLVKCGNIVADETGKVKEKTKQEAMRLVGYLTGALSKVNMTIVKVGATEHEVKMEADKQQRNSFKAGMAVRPVKAK